MLLHHGVEDNARNRARETALFAAAIGRELDDPHKKYFICINEDGHTDGLWNSIITEGVNGIEACGVDWSGSRRAPDEQARSSRPVVGTGRYTYIEMTKAREMKNYERWKDQ